MQPTFTIEEDVTTNEFEDRVVEAFLMAQMEVSVFIVSNLQVDLPVDLGRLRGSLAIDINEANLQTQVSMEGYVIAQEMGLPLGYSGVSSDALVEWVIRKGMTQSETVARGIALSIVEKWEREGRGAKGIIGLAVRGDVPEDLPFGDAELDPIPGGFLDQAFQMYMNLVNNYLLKVV